MQPGLMMDLIKTIREIDCVRARPASIILLVASRRASKVQLKLKSFNYDAQLSS